MIYCFDIDNTICRTNGNNYEDSVPLLGIISKINTLYDKGHHIQMFTARGAVSGIDHTELTAKQLEEWGVKHHELIMNRKPHFDLLVDDKCINVAEWNERTNPKKRGLIAGCFDLIHPGYVRMWEDAKNVCDHLIVALQTDPTIDSPTKNKPVHSLEERHLMLTSIRYVDEVLVYQTEQDLYELLKKVRPDVRILGSDYEGLPYNGDDLNIPIYYHKRNHDWSATNLRKKIKNKEIKE